MSVTGEKVIKQIKCGGVQHDISAKYLENYTYNDILDNFKNSLKEEILYDDLFELKRDSLLIPGKLYHITDYATYSTTSNTDVAKHQFDIIVVALSNDTLSENAKVCLHENDEYFAGSKLESWEIKYCLDNDVTRFSWADATNGKGVIYYMKDEWDNEAPYDFKNILFKKYDNSSILYYTFSYSYVSVFDASVRNKCVYNNKIMPTYDNMGCMILNHNVFSMSSETDLCISNYIGEQSMNNTFGNNCICNKLYSYCKNNTFGNECKYNVLKEYCENNNFYNQNESNILGVNCINNTFGIHCYSNNFGNYCYNNNFEQSCSNNTFGNESYSNIFGNYCSNNTFGNYCYSNIFGNNCYNNNFGQSCTNNIFGESYYEITFGTECKNNIIIKKDVAPKDDNGNIKDNIDSNFDITNYTDDDKINYVRYFKFGNGVRNNIFYTSENTNNYIQMYNIDSCITNKVIELKSPAQASYTTKISMNSSGVVKQYCEADLIL